MPYKLPWSQRAHTPAERRAAVERTARWAKENPERRAAQTRATLFRRKARDPAGLLEKRRRNEAARGKEKRAKKWASWAKRNKERLRDYREQHRPQHASRQRARMAVHRNAFPSWADRKRIASIYIEAATLTKDTGRLYEVDHIIPLQGKTVCGLHVENNLQVLLSEQNRQKSNLLLE